MCLLPDELKFSGKLEYQFMQGKFKQDRQEEETMNDERKTVCLSFRVPRSSFVLILSIPVDFLLNV
jgi:hypothetical protein